MRIKTKKKIIIASIIIFVTVLTIFLITTIYNNWRIANAKIIVTLHDNLEVPVHEKVTISTFIKSMNGKLIKDSKIDTTKIGQKEVSFKYINYDNIEVPYSFTINIVDKTPPLIYSSSNLTLTKDYTGNIEQELFCGDNYDDQPTCEIEGTYDVATPGTYPVTFKGTDSSGNVSTQPINIIVKEPTPPTNNSKPTPPVTQAFSDLVSTYKKDNTKIGIDVSHWQGDIDFQQVKDAGVEFAFIRVGSQRGIGGDYFVDQKFEQNIKGFKKVGIPVGVYFYSYANSKLAAKVEAEWVVEQLKDYKLDLPVVFDWENWSFYQEFNLSFYNLTEMAKSYLKVVEKAGYKGMLYSSKNHLETVWYQTDYPVWLAHYTKETNYQGNYQVWQLCSNGQVPGIKGNVDINVMYE